MKPERQQLYLMQGMIGKMECEIILMDHGTSYDQANNGAYVYLHHRDHVWQEGNLTGQLRYFMQSDRKV